MLWITPQRPRRCELAIQLEKSFYEICKMQLNNVLDGVFLCLVSVSIVSPVFPRIQSLHLYITYCRGHQQVAVNHSYSSVIYVLKTAQLLKLLLKLKFILPCWVIVDDCGELCKFAHYYMTKG